MHQPHIVVSDEVSPSLIQDHIEHVTSCEVFERLQGLDSGQPGQHKQSRFGNWTVMVADRSTQPPFGVPCVWRLITTDMPR